MCWATRLQPLVGGKFLCLCYSQALSEEGGARNGPENDSLTSLPSSFNLYAVCGRGSCFASSSFPTVYCCYLLPAVCTRLPEQPLRPKRKKKKHQPVQRRSPWLPKLKELPETVYTHSKFDRFLASLDSRS